MKLTLFALLLVHLNRQVFSNGNGNATTLSANNTSHESLIAAAHSLFDEYWQMMLMNNPEMATRLGDHRYDDRLTCYSLKCYTKRKIMMTQFLERATQLLPSIPEGSQTQNDIQLFIIIIQNKIDYILRGSYLFPISKIHLPTNSLRRILRYSKFENATSYWNLISRYRAFPKKIDEQIELMRERIRTNFTLHERSLWSLDGSENISISDSPFYKPFLNISSSILAHEIADIQRNASEAVMNHIYAALKKLDDFIEEEYRPNSRTDIGVSSLPNGKQYYQHKLSYHLTDPKATAEKIHATGMSEVQRIADEMEEVIQLLGFNITREEFNDYLRNNEAQLFSSEEDALETYRRVIKDEITPKLPQLFKYIPEKILEVQSIPTDLSKGMKAYYQIASPDNSTPGTFFLDTSSLKFITRYEVMTLAMHEGSPGHHFQNSYAMEQNDIPDFKKYDSFSDAFLEGWALYAEYLGYELGLYDDPYTRYGHLSEEIVRACRMVVDTGIHVFGWSRQKAIDFMMNYTASTLESIEREVDRYITWPGQACAYKYGELKIKEFRKRAETELGEKFDIKEFHDVILRNKGPLELLEKQVERYIEATRNGEFT